MINQHKDLDQSDYERDGDDAAEAMIAELTGGFDPADLFGVCALVCDALYSGDAQDFMKSQLCKDLIETTQSNPDGVHARLAEAMEIEFG